LVDALADNRRAVERMQSIRELVILA
jgi:hypothetical protein